MTKRLTESVREQYLHKASEKICKDAQEIMAFIKAKGLDFVPESCSPEQEAQHCYYVAKEMWEKDGYREDPTEFVNIRNRENDFLRNILP
jgi:hypothetical protein